MAEIKKLYSKEKIGVTVMLVLLTAAIFLAIGYWAGSGSIGNTNVSDEPENAGV